MALNKHAIIKIMGYILGIIGLAMLPSYLLSVQLGEEAAARGFGVTGALIIGTGLVLAWFTREQSKHLSLRDGILVVFLGWFIAALAGCFPYLISG